jgi:phosphate butyryltransferase
MGFTKFDDMVQAVQARGKRIRCAVVAADSRRTLEPVLTARKDGFIEPLLIGDVAAIESYLREIAGTSEGFTVIAASTFEAAAQKAVDLVNQGKADLIMKGRIETSILMRVVLQRENNFRTGKLVSGMTILEVPSYHKLLAYTDGGITLFPDLEQKKQLIENAVAALRKIGIDCPKVAVTAAVEVVNPKMPATVDGRALREMNERGEIKDCIIEGPISYDLAISKEAAQAKGFESPVAGDADLLVWPDVNAGNLAGKALIHSAHARTAAMVLGAKVPILISSRSSSFEEKYLSMALAAV